MAETKTDAAQTVKKVAKKTKQVVAETDIQPIELFADGAEAVADQLNTVAEVSRKLTSRQIAITSGAVVVGVAIGSYAGYRFAEKRLSTKFETLMQEETEKLREHYDAKLEAVKAQTKPSLVDKATALRQQDEADQIVVDQGYGGDLDIVPPSADAVMQEAREKAAGVARENYAIQKANEAVERETVNIFEARDEAAAAIEVWDYAKELKSRDPRYPYVVHLDEWQENSSEYEKMDLTYYEGDEVLANDRDQALGDTEDAIGIDNLAKFGHGSGDPNVVFIRNDVREVLYEVNRSGGMYAQEVHGFDPDQIQHSDYQSRRRMKFDDD